MSDSELSASTDLLDGDQPEGDEFDDGWRDDEPECKRCGGDGMDPWCDYLLPCPDCQGEQRAGPYCT